MPRSATDHGNTKIDKEKAIDLVYNKGITKKEAATLLGVDRTTLFRFLSKNKEETQALETFKNSRADILSEQHLKSTALIDGIIAYYLEPQRGKSRFATLDEHHKIALLKTIGVISGITYDKERLERDLSTENISLKSLQIQAADLEKQREHWKRQLDKL